MKNNFDTLFERILTETSVSGGVNSVYGSGATSTEAAFSKDSYNPGSAIIAKPLGSKVVKRTFPGLHTKRTKNKKSKKT